MPESSLGTDPLTNHFFVDGKLKLGRELFRFQRYQEIETLATGLLGRINKLRFNDDNDKDITVRNQLRHELVSLQLYARYGLADNAARAEDYTRAAAILDPVIDQAAKDDSQEKTTLQKDPQLAPKLLSVALRANLQLGKIDRTETVLDLLNKVTTEGEARGTTQVLQLLAFLIRGQIEEVRKRNDKDELARAIKGYTALLDKQVAKQKGDLKPDFIRVLADCYSSMGEHAKAATELARVPDPKAKPGTDEDRLHRSVQVQLIRELRLSKLPDNLKKARKLLDEVRGPDRPKGKDRPGWARQDFGARREQGELLEAEQKWADAFREWSTLVKILAKQVGKGGQAKENYLECYYHMVYCYLKLGEQKASKPERDRFVRQAAQQAVQLWRSWGDDFGSEASKKRFDELFFKEPALKQQYDQLRLKK
jgi:hypothetical protein